jgi:phosphoribosylformylglycinamidine cyclo-ligase
MSTKVQILCRIGYNNIMSVIQTEGTMVQKTYADAGVDIQEAVSLKERIGKLAESTFTKQVFALHDELGLFSDPTRFKRFKALFRFKGAFLVSSVDGVGTKTKIATAMNNYSSLGFDLVHHSVNDILIRGAIPLFFLDYIAMGRLAPRQVEAIVQGLAQACLEVGCALIGGETAEMPGVYYPGEVDIVGFIVGAAEEDGIIDINTIAPGDIVVALPSSGLHTNGYSLVRAVFNLDNDKSPLQKFYPELGNTLGAALRASSLLFRATETMAAKEDKGRMAKQETQGSSAHNRRWSSWEFASYVAQGICCPHTQSELGGATTVPHYSEGRPCG